jgi:zinc-ribbon domain
MAFCNSCGASMTPGTRFCNKCGAAVIASSPASTAQVGSVPVPVATAPAPTSGGGALKVILIVVGVIVLIGILGLSSLAFFAWRVARHAHIRQDGQNVKVETPFGNIQTAQDPQEAAHNLGVDAYPGSQTLKEGSASVTFGSIHNVTLNSVSTDSLDKVCSFYKAKFPSAMTVTTQADQCTIIANDKKSMITINIKTEGDKTKILITNMTKSDGAN